MHLSTSIGGADRVESCPPLLPLGLRALASLDGSPTTNMKDAIRSDILDAADVACTNRRVFRGFPALLLSEGFAFEMSSRKGEVQDTAFRNFRIIIHLPSSLSSISTSSNRLPTQYASAEVQIMSSQRDVP